MVAPNDTIARKTAKKEIGSKEFMWLRFGEMQDLGGKDHLKEDKWKVGSQLFLFFGSMINLYDK